MLDLSLQRLSPNEQSVLNTQYTNNKPAVAAQAGLAGQSDLAAQVGPAYQLELSQTNDWSDPEVRRLKETGKIECQTCKNRTYQDGSNDPSVSFKSPGHISPESSAAVVRSHEQEHVVNEQASAQSKDRKVVSQSVQIFTSVCPECGRSYVSGGETRTTTADQPQQTQESELGTQVDMLI